MQQIQSIDAESREQPLFWGTGEPGVDRDSEPDSKAESNRLCRNAFFTLRDVEKKLPGSGRFFRPRARLGSFGST